MSIVTGEKAAVLDVPYPVLGFRGGER